MSAWRAALVAATPLVALAAALLPARLAADTATTDHRTVTRLAEGVYEIRHQDPLAGWVTGNSLVVIGTRSVFVVDACSVAWEAQADIAQIRAWTKLPVRWLLNTHWHHDHNAGNRDYMNAFPGLTILAHAETKRRLDANAPYMREQILKSLAQTRAPYQKLLDSGNGSDGKPLTPEKRARLAAIFAQADSVEADTRAFIYQAPTRTFEDSLTLDLGGRTVKVMFLGRGNTGGDGVAWLPAERILATGDLVVSPVPYTFDGYPAEWVRTLERVAAFHAASIVPGHGDVMHDSRYVLQLRDLMKAIVTRIDTTLDRDYAAPLDSLRQAIDVKAMRAGFLGDDQADGPFFDYAINSLIEIAYHEARQR